MSRIHVYIRTKRRVWSSYTNNTLSGKTKEMDCFTSQYILKLQKTIWWNPIVIEQEEVLRDNDSNLIVPPDEESSLENLNDLPEIPWLLPS